MPTNPLDNPSNDTLPGGRPDRVMVCVNYRAGQASCAGRGGREVATALENEIARRRVAVEVERCICLGRCTEGPTVRFAPAGKFFLGTKVADVADIVGELEAQCGLRDDPFDDMPPPGT